MFKHIYLYPLFYAIYNPTKMCSAPVCVHLISGISFHLKTQKSVSLFNVCVSAYFLDLL